MPLRRASILTDGLWLYLPINSTINLTRAQSCSEAPTNFSEKKNSLQKLDSKTRTYESVRKTTQNRTSSQGNYLPFFRLICCTATRLPCGLPYTYVGADQCGRSQNFVDKAMARRLDYSGALLSEQGGWSLVWSGPAGTDRRILTILVCLSGFS